MDTYSRMCSARINLLATGDKEVVPALEFGFGQDCREAELQQQTGASPSDSSRPF
jgi:hypothetical protein